MTIRTGALPKKVFQRLLIVWPIDVCVVAGMCCCWGLPWMGCLLSASLAASKLLMDAEL